MTALAPHVTAFFQERLPLERAASVNTCDSYAYAFKLLLDYASKKLKVAPSRLELEQIDEPLVVGFLNHLETMRANRPAPAMYVLQRSNPSCTSWSIVFRLPWSRSGASSSSR